MAKKKVVEYDPVAATVGQDGPPPTWDPGKVSQDPEDTEETP